VSGRGKCAAIVSSSSVRDGVSGARLPSLTLARADINVVDELDALSTAGFFDVQTSSAAHTRRQLESPSLVLYAVVRSVDTDVCRVNFSYASIDRVSCAKTDEPITMPFERHTRVGPSNLSR